MKGKIIIVIISILFFFKLVNAIENKILFKINNKIITSIDIQNEINYLNSINPSFKDLESEKVFEISKNSLIRNRIKEITLEKMVKKLELEKSDFEKNLIVNYSNIGMTDTKELQDYLMKFNIKIQDLEKKITIDSYWNQLIYDLYNKNIKIDLDQIKKNILKNNMQKEFLLSEIVFSLDINENLEEKLKNIHQSIEDKGFENSALIYSTSDSLDVGGRLGWISQGSIGQEILDEILETKIGNYTKPIKIPSGFLILKINETREIEKNINLEQEIEKIIKIKTNEQLNQYSNLFFNKIKKDIIINEL